MARKNNKAKSPENDANLQSLVPPGTEGKEIKKMEVRVVKAFRDGKEEVPDLRYVDAKGDKYDNQPGYTEGDVVLLTEDEVAFRFSKAKLSGASTMFRDMFATSALIPAEVDLPVDADVLHRTLRTLRKPDTFKEKFSESIITAVKFAISYELREVARNLLFNSCAHDPLELRFEAFALACQLDDPITGCRILRQAGTGEVGRHTLLGWQQPRGKSLRPNSDQWTIKDSERLTHLWLSALGSAVAAAERMLASSFRIEEDRQNQGYWMIVCGGFIHQVTKYQPAG